MKVLHKSFSANLKTLDKATWLALFETTFLKKLSKKVGKHKYLEKGVLKILAKYIQNPVKYKTIHYFCKKLQFRSLIRFWRCFWQVMYRHILSGITCTDRGPYKGFFWLNCLECEQVNVSCLVIIDLDKMLISVWIQFKTNVTTYLARLRAGIWLTYI